MTDGRNQISNIEKCEENKNVRTNKHVILNSKNLTNQLASEKIYECFSKNAGVYDMDENLFDIKIKKI